MYTHFCTWQTNALSQIQMNCCYCCYYYYFRKLIFFCLRLNGNSTEEAKIGAWLIDEVEERREKKISLLLKS